MALHYDTRKCDLENVSFNTIDSMIHMTMLIDVGHFTEKNIEDVYYRICIMEMFNGSPFLMDAKTHKSILADLDLIKKFIGMKTNVINLSIKKWFAKQLKNQGVK